MIGGIPATSDKAGFPHAEAPPLLTCIECGGRWTDPAERWRMKVTDEAPVEAVPYCESCATREFGPARRHLVRLAQPPF